MNARDVGIAGFEQMQYQGHLKQIGHGVSRGAKPRRQWTIADLQHQVR